MRLVSRYASLAGVLLATCTAGAEEVATCPRCEHRFVTDVSGKRVRGKAGEPCRVCRVQQYTHEAGESQYRYAWSKDEAERAAIREKWGKLREDLRTCGYVLGELDDDRDPQLAPLETPEALALALFDEAERFERRATWSERMAKEFKSARGVWQVVRRSLPGDTKRADWAYNDRIAAWEERALLFGAMAERYRAQARDLSADALAGALPVPDASEEPEGKIPEGSVARLVEESRVALRELVALERQVARQLLARTRDPDAESTPPDLAATKKLFGDAFSTSFLVNAHRERVREIDWLHGDLLMDESLEGFFERAPVIARALHRYASAGK